MANNNPFLTQSGGMLAPTPAFKEFGGFNPAIIKMAKEFAKQSTEFGITELGQRGLLKSSDRERITSNAFAQGMQQALGTFQQQQDVFGRWAAGVNQLQIQSGAGQRGPNFFESLLQGALPGAAIGGQFGGGPGALIGAGIGAGASLFGSVKAGSGIGKALGAGKDKFLGIF